MQQHINLYSSLVIRIPTWTKHAYLMFLRFDSDVAFTSPCLACIDKLMQPLIFKEGLSKIWAESWKALSDMNRWFEKFLHLLEGYMHRLLIFHIIQLAR